MQLVPISGHLGAELHGLDLRELDDGELTQVKDLIHRFEVVVFPGAALTPEEHMGLAGRLGEVNVFPTAAVRGNQEPTFQVISDGPDSPPEADYWHTDVTWVATPPTYALLQAEVVPERGGDTLWASMTAAHDALSPVMQDLVAGLEVEHDNESFLDGMIRKMGDSEPVLAFADELRAAYPPVVHPLVRTHPDTGRRALFLGGRFMRRIVGMTDLESACLLDLLRRHIEDPRFQCRWRWSVGDLAIWDERSTNHRNSADYFPQRRTIRRIEVAGDRPYFDRSAVLARSSP